MGALSPMHWLIIVGVLVLLFGAKRLPDAARSLGRSARILKAEVKEMSPDPATTGIAAADDAAPAATAARPGPAVSARAADGPVSLDRSDGQTPR